MKAFVVLAAVLASASAGQIVLSGLQGLTIAGAPAVTYSAPAITYSAPAVIAPAVTKTQYHSQDELGQASFGHAHAGNAHAAVRDSFGNVAGSYAYINPDGKEIRVNYIADGAGFRVASNALPIAPTAPPAPEPVALVAPLPVEDTEDVKQAKAAHAKLVQEAIARNAEADKADADKPQSRRKRGVIAAAPLAVPAITYSAVAVPAVREATLTKIVNTPNHAISYRVD